MAQPTAPYTASALQRATDTHFSSGDEVGLTTKAEPSAGQKAQGHVSGLAAPAAHANYWEHGVGLWLTYLAGLNTDAEFLNYTFDWTNAHQFLAGLASDGVNLLNAGNVVFEGAGEVNYVTPRSRTVLVPILDCVTSAWTQPNSSQPNLVTTTNSAQIKIPFALPSGSELTSVRCGVQQGATSGTDLTFEVYKAVADKSGTSASPTVTQLGSTDTADDDGPDILTTGAITETIDLETTNYYAYITASANAADATGDAIWWLELNYDEPGLRTH